MTAPTVKTRRAVYDRDGQACVACKSTMLTFQHRRAVGMGGSKMQPPPVDGLTLCITCNEACEHTMQRLALVYGWKVRRWADPVKVPVFYPHEHQWFRLEGTERFEIGSIVAFDLMHAVYGDEYWLWRTEVMT